MLCLFFYQYSVDVASIVVALAGNLNKELFNIDNTEDEKVYRVVQKNANISCWNKFVVDFAAFVDVFIYKII